MKPERSARLFTPGPLSTSPTVRQAMLRDVGSRDPEFLKIVDDIRNDLLKLAGTSQQQGFEAILMQGSGTFGIESVVDSVCGPDDRLLVVVNGAYGKRIHQIARARKLNCKMAEFDERQVPDIDSVQRQLSDGSFSHLAIVHCETTTGILNPIRAFGELAESLGLTYIVDAMSSFGGIPIDVRRDRIDFLISSANKCIQGVPGFSFVICDRQRLLVSRHLPTSVSLDLRAQLDGLESNGQFRFTPPTHAILAFRQALAELEQEGGVKGRTQRYARNQKILVSGLRQMGLVETIRDDLQSPIITTFDYPADDRFEFFEFYTRLADDGFVIYPGKLGDHNCFRIGSIGHLFETDMEELVVAIRQTLNSMGVSLASSESIRGRSD